jgi:hypothetical protein
LLFALLGKLPALACHARHTRPSNPLELLIAGCAAVSFSLSQAADTEEKLGTVIGIDLGTTYSCVGVYKNGKVEIIANDQGKSSVCMYNAYTPHACSWRWVHGSAAEPLHRPSQATVSHLPMSHSPTRSA